jgi:hypothetical protein
VDLTKCRLRCASKKGVKFLYGQPGLADDGSKRARLEVARGVAWNGHYSRRIIQMCQDVVAADDAVDNKSRSRERPYDTPAAHCGQSRGRHG